MNRKTWLGLWGGLWLMGGMGLGCRVASLPPPSSPEEALESFLRTAPITQVDKEERLGRMGAWVVTLSDGTTSRRAMFKTIRRNRPAMMPDSYAYELAAYELDKLLGLGLVPMTVERSIEGRSGSLQLFLEGVETEKSRLRKNLQPPDPQAFQDRLDEILILEDLVCCPRTDLGDILIQTDTWRVWRVDFSEAFRPASEMLPECEVKRCSRRVLSALQGLDEARVRDRLKAHINQAEMEALLKRRRLLLAEVQRLIAERGEASVLYRP